MNTSQDIKMQMVDDNVRNKVRYNAVKNDGNEVGQNAVQNPNAHEETYRVKVNCTSEDTLQQVATYGTRSNNAPVYDSNGSVEVPKDENGHDHDIFNMLTQEV
nr:hypothetical protein [Tanacetum cinerariifolium]